MNKLLGININNLKFFENIKKKLFLNLIQIAFIAKKTGVNSITINFKNNFKNINENDIIILNKIIKININIEMLITDEILDFILKIKPQCCCFVPKKKKNMSIKTGLNVIEKFNKISTIINLLNNYGIQSSLFIDPNINQIEAALNTGSNIVELNTVMYSLSKKKKDKEFNLNKIKMAAYYAKKKGLIINAGYGLNYNNVKQIAQIKEINELNIGHSIINESIIIGLNKAVKKMLLLIL